MKPGDVLWIDEAGLLDVRSMSGVFNIAKQHEAKVVLSGGLDSIHLRVGERLYGY